MVIGVVDNDLLTHQVTHTAYAQHTLEEVEISIRIQHHRIIIRFISEESAQWSQYRHTGPHAHPHYPLAITRHLVARIVNQVIHNENQHRHHNRHSKATLPDDAAKRRADEKEDKACQRHGQFLVPGRLVAPHAIIGTLDIITFERPIIAGAFAATHCRRQDLLLFIQSKRLEYTVHIIPFRTFHARLFYSQRISLLQIRCRPVSAIDGLRIVCPPHAVIPHLHRVDGGLEHSHVLTVVLVAHDAFIRHFKA